MNIKIDEKFSIRSDSNNVMIIKTLNDRESVQGYYPNLESCLNGFLSLKMRMSTAETINELIEEIKSLQHALNALFKPFKMKLVEEQ